LKLQGRPVRLRAQARTYSSCCAGVSKVMLLYTTAWSGAASQGMTSVTCAF
jgi:hypothetical protein